MTWTFVFAHFGLLFAAILFVVSVQRRYLSPISHIPGPLLASFSRLWHLRQIWSGKQNLKLIEQHDRHGHFVRMAHDEVSVSHPGAIKALLLATLPKGQCTRKLFGWMNKFANDKRPMNLDEFFTFVAFDITGEVVFSRPFGFMDKGEDVNHSIAMNVGMEVYIAFASCPWAISSTPPCRPWRNAARTQTRADLAAHWFKGLEKAEQDGSKLFNLRCLQSFATANVGAGSDTVSAGLQSFVYHLLRHPTGWGRIADEIAEAHKLGRCQDDIISYEDATQLPYLQAAIKEGLRMFAPISMGLPRVAPKGGVTIGNTFFPQGVTLNVSPSVIHSSKEIWGPDAREFNPDRWLAPDAAAKEKFFIPWGVGYASCPGQHVARMQLSKISATVVRDYEIVQVVPGAEWKWSAWFTAVPHSWPVYITKRGAQ
ncbi:hypothetical protein PG995_009532 [Apiospora arundinis]